MTLMQPRQAKQSPHVIAFSAYESYLQPVLLASIGGLLARSGMKYRLVDLSVDAMDLAEAERAKAFVIAVPLFDSLEPVCLLVGNLRALNPGTPIFFVGPHATLNRRRLEAEYGGTVVDLGEVVDRLAGAGIAADGGMPSVSVGRLDRQGVPPVTAYSYPGGLLDHKTVGNVETTVGCRFACTHCTVFTLARQHVDYGSIEDIIAEIDCLVNQGADHITFMDAEFMNDGEHGPAVIEAMHRQFPQLTFDMISRVDRILKYESVFRRFFDLGCTFVTTAIEFPDDRVLKILRKGYRTKDLLGLSDLVAATDIRLNPTLIVFTPWIDVEAVHAGERLLAESGLTQIIDPVQYRTRLMITKGSPLLETDALQGVPLIDQEFSFDWVHPDPAMDALYRERIGSANHETGFKRCCVRC